MFSVLGMVGDKAIYPGAGGLRAMKAVGSTKTLKNCLVEHLFCVWQNVLSESLERIASRSVRA